MVKIIPRMINVQKIGHPSDISLSSLIEVRQRVLAI